MDIEGEFIEESRAYLADEYARKIDLCLSLLTAEQIWWRANEHSNSIGNLVLHLCGNIRQYIVSGIGGADDIRQRDLEFAQRGSISGEELRETLGSTIEAVAFELERLDPASLSEPRTIQGSEMTVFHALYHAIEHFSMHTGQIIHITKQLTSRDLEFYTFDDGTVQRHW